MNGVSNLPLFWPRVLKGEDTVPTGIVEIPGERLACGDLPPAWVVPSRALSLLHPLHRGLLLEAAAADPQVVAAAVAAAVVGSCRSVTVKQTGISSKILL
jgi:hypothetical protein